MGAVNARNVLTGAPDQATTGAILSAPATFSGTLPAAVDDTPDPAFVGSGYIDEEGLTLTPERSTEPIRDWSGTVVREILTEFAAKLAWAHLETSVEALRNYLGDDQVTVTAATSSEGKRITALLKAAEMPRKPYLFRIKDGAARVLIVVPDGQVTEQGEVAFVKSGAIKWPVVLSTYPDASGVNVYIYLDDGQVLTAGVPVVTAVEPAGQAAGELVTVSGTRLAEATGVTVGGTAADFVVAGDDLVVVLPVGTTGTVDVVVTNAVGSSTAFAYTAA